MAERPKYSKRNVFQYGSLCHVKDVTCVWNPGDNSVQAEDYYDLYRKLGGEKPQDSFALIDLFNLLGQKGWELASSSDDDGSQEYLFKRTYVMEGSRA